MPKIGNRGAKAVAAAAKPNSKLKTHRKRPASPLVSKEGAKSTDRRRTRSQASGGASGGLPRVLEEQFAATVGGNAGASGSRVRIYLKTRDK